MAGKKIQAQLTPEEKLQQALVPKAEQPYKVPANWCWTKLGSISLIKGGKRLPPGKKLNDIKTGYPYIRVTDFDSNSVDVNNIKYIDEETYKILDNYKISINDIYISIARSIRKVGIIPEILNGAILTENAAKITNIILQNQIYLLYILCSEFCQNQMKESAIATTQSKLALFRIANIKLPLPPLAEQQRIVERIESLFAKLDETKETLQNVLDAFETRKAAILHKAFTGDLTANWRKRHGVSMNSWKEKIFSDLIDDVRLGLVKSKLEQSYDRMFPYLKMNNITTGGGIDLSDLIHVNATDDEVRRFSLKFADFLFNTRNSFELVGKNSVWKSKDKKIVLYNNNIMRIRFKKIANSFFVSYYLNSHEGIIKLDKCKKNTTNVAAIYAKDLNNITIPIPTLNEQNEIVRIIDDLLAKEQQAKELAENALVKVDLIKKAILAHAFRGELGTNNPADEPAVELLKQVL